MTGKNLERLVATLERVLTQSNAVIESPSRRLIDRDTDRPREHDVLITWDHGHHQITTAIECRDRSRPVGVPEIEAFADKCNATGVNSGVIVSATGFRNSARKKAAARSITCMDLTEVEGFDWLSTEFSMVNYEREFGQISIVVVLVGAESVSLSVIIDANGTELSRKQVAQAIVNSLPLPDNPEELVGVVAPLAINVQTEGWTMRDHQGKIWSIDHMLVNTTVTMKKTVTGVQMHRYAGGGKDYAIATVDTAVDKRPAKIVMVRNEDDTTSVYLALDQHGRKAT